MRVLLASPCVPFGRSYGDAFTCSANAAFQLTWAQDGFVVEDIMPFWGLDLIAANLLTPTTVLHYATLARFTEEIQQGYEIIGLTGTFASLPRLRVMADAVRQHAPQAKLVLGGYAALLPAELTRGLADLVCRGDGIAFMRELLQEPAQPFRHPYLSFPRRLLSLATGERTGVIVVSVGCANGCDFCATSAFFAHRPVRYLTTGEELYRVIAEQRAADPRLTSFTVCAEDFFADIGLARGFLAAVRRQPLFADLMVFTSVRAISQFTPEEVAAMGITRVWLGFEGELAGYEKLQGRPFAELVCDLEAHGISTVVSMMAGFDYQTPGMARAELAKVVAMEPAVTQVLLFTPCPGTPAWERLRGEQRLDPKIADDHRRHDGMTLLFRQPHGTRAEWEELVRELARVEYRELGPSVFRLLRVLLRGLQVDDGGDAVLKLRRAAYRRRLRRAQLLFIPGILFAPTAAVRDRVKCLAEEVAAAVGPMSPGRGLLGWLLLPLYVWTRLRNRHDWRSLPAAQRREYPAAVISLAGASA